ncbi:MAG TPA: hypothetical protein VGQ00_02560 [Candidatus Norongarragalinales archaeon]|jgi:hypothetical protein|nr:hypothetical protein [Candidatus Norongarragalinales archaeon]
MRKIWEILKKNRGLIVSHTFETRKAFDPKRNLKTHKAVFTIMNNNLKASDRLLKHEKWLEQQGVKMNLTIQRRKAAMLAIGIQKEDEERPKRTTLTDVEFESSNKKGQQAIASLVKMALKESKKLKPLPILKIQ